MVVLLLRHSGLVISTINIKGWQKTYSLLVTQIMRRVTENWKHFDTYIWGEYRVSNILVDIIMIGQIWNESQSHMKCAIFRQEDYSFNLIVTLTWPGPVSVLQYSQESGFQFSLVHCDCPATLKQALAKNIKKKSFHFSKVV